MSVQGRHKLYVPQLSENAGNGNATISVVDLDAPGDSAMASPALMATIDLGYSDPVTAMAGTPSLIVAVSGTTGRVYQIDPVRDRVSGSFVIPPAYRMAFSAPYVYGVALDPRDMRAVLAMWNGFALLDVKAAAIMHVIDAPPSNQFAFDWSRQLVIAPFNSCSTHLNSGLESLPICEKVTDEAGNVMPAGVTVIDTSAGVPYTYQDPNATSTTAPLGGAYAAAVDESLGKAVVSSAAGAHLLDLAGASFDQTRRYVTTPHGSFSAAADITGTTAVDSATHSGLFVTSSGLVVAPLASASAGQVEYRRASLPAIPDRSFMTDEMIVTRGNAVETPLAVLVSSDRRTVARIDLISLLAAPSTMSTAYPDELEIAADGVAAALVYLDVTSGPSR